MAFDWCRQFNGLTVGQTMTVNSSSGVCWGIYMVDVGICGRI